MSHLRTIKRGLLGAVLILIFFLPVRGFAAPIDPGFDLFSTPAGGAFVDLSSAGLGLVDLIGDPIGPGNTDTIVERLTGLPDNGTGIIDVEIVALSLRSVSPVDISSSFFDVFVSLDLSTPSLGRLDVTLHGPGGGTFDSFFDVFVEVVFTEVGNPLNMFSFLVQDQLTSTDSTWSHTPPSGYPNSPNFPAGGFYPGPIQHTGPHPITIPSVVPVPAALPLFAAGFSVLGFIGWRRRRTA